ncbi:hypothetical protein [Streptomyces californicus]|uniref:hypothetical protein n=1 Tax=Streptomyces californicus TaxID=67351 RepID=UPI0037B14874
MSSLVLLVDLPHRYPKADTPMLGGLGGMTVIAAVVVPIVVRLRPGLLGKPLPETNLPSST